MFNRSRFPCVSYISPQVRCEEIPLNHLTSSFLTRLIDLAVCAMIIKKTQIIIVNLLIVLAFRYSSLDNT